MRVLWNMTHKAQFKVNIMFLLLLIFNNKETNSHHACSQQYIKVYGKCARFHKTAVRTFCLRLNFLRKKGTWKTEGEKKIHTSIELWMRLGFLI